ncbi:MAG TPA: energy transducer TonB [Mucilaginibacter sp.]|nr:energy transducer TonB [Mucilaginibacter sp.]
MKNTYSALLVILLSLSACFNTAHNAPENKTQPHAKTNGKVIVTKNYSVVVTENDNSFDEFAKFDDYVKKHIKNLPGVNGQVMISFTTEKNGKLTHAKIEKSLTKAADEEALRLVKEYSEWEPNTIDGNSQSGRISTGIVFGKVIPKNQASK